ncbi:hypothetical protein [Pseudoalteromonas spongiae]|uniref:hypothetical protein n=1 Tax=Pseudoalteromonas spongiae TaxID=298657 RepID=UPI000C2D1978|nr:hypothetical protein [Pseudoalteromonas spongiae]
MKITIDTMQNRPSNRVDVPTNHGAQLTEQGSRFSHLVNDKKPTKFHQTNEGLVQKPIANNPEETSLKSGQRVLLHKHGEDVFDFKRCINKEALNNSKNSVNEQPVRHDITFPQFIADFDVIYSCADAGVNSQVTNIKPASSVLNGEEGVQSHVQIQSSFIPPHHYNSHSLITNEKKQILQNAIELDIGIAPQKSISDLNGFQLDDKHAQPASTFDAIVNENTKNIESALERQDRTRLNEKTPERAGAVIDNISKQTETIQSNSESLVLKKLSSSYVGSSDIVVANVIENKPTTEVNGSDVKKLSVEPRTIPIIDNELGKIITIAAPTVSFEYAALTIDVKDVPKGVPNALKISEATNSQDMTKMLVAKSDVDSNCVVFSESTNCFRGKMLNNIAFSKDVNDLLHNNQLNINLKSERPATIHWAHTPQKAMPSLEAALDNLGDALTEVASAVSLQSTPHSLPSVEQVFRAQLKSIDQIHIVENFKSHFAQIDEAILKQSPSMSISLESQYLQGGKVQIDIEQGRLTIHFDVSSSHVLAQLTQSLPDLKLVLNERYPQFNTQFSMNDSEQQRQHQEERDEQAEGEQS